MTYLITVILIFLSASAYACPDLAGKYICNEGDPKKEYQIQFTKLNRNSFEITWEFDSGVSWKNKILADGFKRRGYGSSIYTDTYTTITCDSTALTITHSIAPSKLAYRDSSISRTDHIIYSLDHNSDLRYAKNNLFSDNESNSFPKTCKRLN